MTFGPKNSSLLIDESQNAPPDYLDPGAAFFSQDGSYLNAVFQDLAIYNGSNANVQLPVEASSWSVSNNSQEYTFTIRPDVYFSNGDNVTAYTIWFSYVRELYMNSPSEVGTSNWNLGLTMNTATDWFSVDCSNDEPWGLTAAISSVTGTPLGASECGYYTNAINYMLSHFNPSNKTQLQIMSYAHQAYSTPNSMTFVLRTMKPYAYIVSDLAGFSGSHTVDPAFVDAHGGVVANTNNYYLDNNCEPGTGPYVCKSVGVGLSEVVLQKNPHYWAAKKGGKTLKTGLPWVITPAQIYEIDIKYGLTGTVLYEDFGTNVAAIGPSNPGVSGSIIPEWGPIWDAYQWKSYFSFSQVNRNFGGQDFTYYLGMNSQRYPTNITDFRKAVFYAMNYSELAQTEIYFNGTSYGQTILGPAAPSYGALYNPNNAPLPKQNIALAAHYLALAGQQAGFYVVLPNGTTIGDPTGKALQSIDIDYIAPLSTSSEVQLEIYQDSLAAVGIPTALVGETSAQYDANAISPATAPSFSSIAWGLDWPDPWFGQFVCFYTTNCGISSYVSNPVAGPLAEQMAYSTNVTAQLQAAKTIYTIEGNDNYYIWLPWPDQTFFMQPYLQGVYFNIYTNYYYNLMYYQPVTKS